MKVVYFNGKLMQRSEVRISPDDRGFLFGDGVYDVLRAYRGKLFQFDAHFARLKHSLAELRIKEPEDLDNLPKIARDVLMQNLLNGTDANVYVQITRGEAIRTHAFPPDSVTPTFFVSAKVANPPVSAWVKGARIITVEDIRWGRCDIKSVNLLPNVLASQAAKDAGAFEAVFVRDGVVVEGSHTSLCAVKTGKIITHPLNPNVLPGVTRRVVLELGEKLDIPIVEEPITLDGLRDMNEVMLLGTTSEVVPVVQVDDWTVANGEPGPVTRRLQEALKAMIRGK